MPPEYVPPPPPPPCEETIMMNGGYGHDDGKFAGEFWLILLCERTARLTECWTGDKKYVRSSPAYIQHRLNANAYYSVQFYIYT